MLNLSNIASKVFGSSNGRRLKGLRAIVDETNALEAEVEALSDEALRARTDDFRKQLEEGATLESLMAPAFATVREAAKRTLGQRHFDVQLIGGRVLHEGRIAEMKTGEGKTLVATLAVYLNALTGRGVHVVTVNDYLAKRDSEWMGQVYRFLGLTVGCITNDVEPETRKEQYACDVLYGTNNEFGFDYLRDNMNVHAEEMVQRGHYFAIVDEVDSILIDEARTPLIISGPLDDKAELYVTIDKFIPNLVDEDFELDEKQKQVSLTESGNEHIEKLLQEAKLLQGESLYDIENVSVVHHVNQALRAHKLFQRDRDYIVKKGEVVIIDEFTGRMMEGRRFSEGLHQALEAKEGVEILPENQTLASITFQNYFRLYEKLAGMTGTASTEASEFGDIYGLEVIEIPTNVDVARIDEHDEVYRTLKEKSEAIVAQVADCKMRGQPILVGTTSIERSEQLSALMKDRAFIRELGQRLEKIAEELPEKEQQRADYLKDIGGYLQSLARDTKRNEAAIPHQVLNARFHEQEAQIIANAGIPGAVTIATNMAGRGTDIQLGGNIDMKLMDWLEEQKKSDNPPSQDDIDAKREEITATLASDKQKALDAGGLYVIGTERHESRRIDNQLRGRSGRQGDPGHSKFYLSLEDDLMRIFGSDRMDGMLKKLGLQDGEAITHPWINKALEKAQGKVEERNFDMRKQILKYDDVMNDQRKVIFDQRIDIMEHDDVSETVTDMRHLVIGEMVSKYIPENAYAEQWDTAGLKQSVEDVFGLDLPIADWANEEGIADEELTERLTKEVDKKAAVKAADFGPDMMRNIEKMVLLQTLDHLWREHLVTLEHLRQVIGFRSYGQRDPLNEYKSEAFTLFESMLVRLREAVTGQLMHIELAPEDMDEMMQQYDELPQMTAQLIDPLSGHDELAESEDDPLAALRPNGQLLAADERVHPSEMDPNRPETWGKVSRNALCPCGSGKRYKRCHGKNK